MKLPSTRETVRAVGRNLLSTHHWRARIVLWTAGAAVGGAAVAFAWLADHAQALLQRLLGVSMWWPWLLAPCGFALIAWLTRRYFPGAEGSGIPQTIFTQQPDAGEAGQRLLRPRIALGRALLAAAGLFCGGSIGREGPTVHMGIPAGLLAPSLSVGAGLGQVAADLGNQDSAVPSAILGMCGYLAGVTQAPLTSFVIVMEMTVQHAMLLPLTVTAAIATAVSKLLSPPLYQTLAQRYLQVT